MSDQNNKSVYDLSIVAFDVETTGLKSGSDRIVELGAVKFHGGSTVGEFSTLINPDIPIPAEVSAIHGITDIMVSDKAYFSQKAEELVSFFGDSIVIAHNAAFDWGFFIAEMKRAGKEAPAGIQVFDTKFLAKKAFPNLKHYGLEFLSDRLAIEKGRSHRALDDARTCLKLFIRCIDELSFMGLFGIDDLAPFSIQTLSRTSSI